MPMDVSKYGGRKVWERFSLTIRRDRAKGRCECTGDCASDPDKPRHSRRCTTRDGDPLPCRKCNGVGRVVVNGSLDPDTEPMTIDADCPKCKGTCKSGRKVVLTVAHLWKKECTCAPNKCTIPAHVAAMCQACHLAYDIEHHIRNRKLSAEKKRLPLFADLL
jgi:hypothetical protein